MFLFAGCIGQSMSQASWTNWYNFRLWSLRSFLFWPNASSSSPCCSIFHQYIMIFPGLWKACFILVRFVSFFCRCYNSEVSRSVLPAIFAVRSLIIHVAHMVTLRSCYLIQWLCCCAAIRFLSEKGSGGRGVTNTGYTCDEQDLRQAAELLELPSVHGSFRKDQLANALQASKEEIQRLLETLGLTSEILLQQFCQATMNRSARILHETVPARDMACLDTGCLDTMNVSIDELLNTPLVAAPPSPDLVSDGTTTAMLAEDFQQPRDLLREVLQRFFDRYPSPSFQASTLSLLQGGSRPHPEFQAGGFLISDQVEQEFTRSALLATRWVEALEILKLEYHNEKVGYYVLVDPRDRGCNLSDSCRPMC